MKIGVTAERSRLTVTTTVGLAQILAWGSSYYLISVLATPIAHDTGWPHPWIMGGLSLGFLVSGLISPAVGRMIQKRGGRTVLALSAVLLSTGLLLLATAPSLPFYVAAWLVLGLAMGAGLYDPAFSTIGRLYGESARGAITTITLFGGFASTVCWPLSATLVEHVGWRGTCATYAASPLLVTLPLYWFGLPPEIDATVEKSASTAHAAPLRSDHKIVFLLLASGFTLAYVIMTVVSVHLLTILQDRGLALAAAVGLGALVGPSQVGARVLETIFARKRHPIWSLLASTILVAIGLGMLVGAPGIAGAGLVLYGAGSGIRSIARGTVPLALFGREGYAVLMGKLAMPALLAQAAAPFLGAVLLEQVGTTATLAVLCSGAVVNIVLVAALVPFASGGRYLEGVRELKI